MKKNWIIANIAIFASVGILYVVYAMTTPISFEFTDDEIKKYSADGTTLVIKPLLTQDAYTGGFYKYYAGLCGNECLDIPINQTEDYKYTSSRNAINVLKKMNYPMVTDYEWSKDPGMIQKYDRVILLHSEYATQEMFDSITSHPDVIYLYPNSLYGKVVIHDNHMRLISGHDYPNHSVKNGFGWKYDNSPEEYDNICDGYEWKPVPNGWQLSCYPENSFYQYKEILEFIR